MTKTADVYTRITDTIIAELEQGTRPWAQPWQAGHAAGPVSRPLRACGRPYSGINVVMLWLAAMKQGFAAPLWMTFRQAKELGAHVRKGEKGTLVVYAGRVSRTEHDEATGEDVEREIPFMKGYTVFNVEQIEGLPGHFYSRPEPPAAGPERIWPVEEFFAALGAKIAHYPFEASYNVSLDRILMPYIDLFRDAESYYATLAHEVTHWTRHPSRLDRDFGRKRWGDEGYAMEELVAELGAAFLCADLGLAPRIREDHAPYIASWLKVLKQDKRAIFTAASHAQKAADYLHGFQAGQEQMEAAA